VFDLKAKLAAAGVVTKDQVASFEEKEAKARAEKEAKRKAAKEKAAKRKGSKLGNKSGNKPGKPGKKNSKNPAKQGKKNPSKGRPDYWLGMSADSMKELNRGEAYDRIRKIIDHNRLDDKERLIPKDDDQAFNFVAATGSIRRLYLTADTVKSLSEGKSAISAYMSHHGLSHCVVPKELALELAKVFPTWLRHLRGYTPINDEPEVETKSETKPATA
jgi:hypothetical protein